MASRVLACVLIVLVGWYFRTTREGSHQQNIANLHSQYLMGLNLLVADAQQYSKTDNSIIPLLASVASTNAAPAEPRSPRK